MKEISKSIIKKTVKKKFEEAKDWCKLRHNNYYVMRIDIETGEIWVDLLFESNWKSYGDSDIRRLETTGLLLEDMENGYVNDAIKKLTEAGWNVID